MARITWTDSPPVDGATVLTAAMWEQLKSDIVAQLGEAGASPGNLDGDNLANGAVSRSKLATGNRDVIQAVTIPLLNAVPSTGKIGFQKSATVTKEFYGSTAKVDGSIVGVDYVADEVATAACTVQLAIAGSATGSSDTLSVSGSQQVVEREFTTGLSVSDGNRVGIVVQGSGGTTDVYGGFAVIYFNRQLA